MKKFIFHSILLSSALLLCGCGNDATDEGKAANETPEVVSPELSQGALELSAQEQKYVEKSNGLAFEVLGRLHRDATDKNVLFSPVSLTCVLGMLHSGATAQASSEIEKLFDFGNEGAESLNVFCKKLIKDVPSLDNAVTLQWANCVACDEQVSLEQNFQQEMSGYYDAEMPVIDFGSAAAAAFINDWCARKTQGMIAHVVDELDGLMAMINAVYFKAPWASKFDQNETADDTFTSEEGTKLSVPMMRRVGAAYYGEEDAFKVLGLPYSNGEKWTMYMLLPKDGKTLNDVVSQLNAGSWSNILKRTTDRQLQAVDIQVPRFKAESSFNLNDVLQAMGVSSIFKGGSLQQVSENFKEELAVSLIKQKAALEVAEEGTEASAVTIAVEMTSTGEDISGVKIPQFKADRPFVYLIQEAASGSVFFVGTYHGK